MKLPNFLIIGAAKSGTTALNHYLDQHPDIFMCPVKEGCFFNFLESPPNFKGPGDDSLNRRAITDLDEYHKMFEPVESEKAIGEASVWYLYDANAPKNISRHIPDVRLIAVLRNPVDRAYSSYLMTVKHEREPRGSFEEALQQEDIRIKENWEYIWHHRSSGFYYEQLTRYFEIFEPHQIKIFLYEDFQDSPLNVIQDIFRFLKVDETFVPDMSLRLMATGIPKNILLLNLLNKPNLIKKTFKHVVPKSLWHQFKTYLNQKILVKPEMPSDLRNQLVECYRNDIIKLQDMLKRDLSHWLK